MYANNASVLRAKGNRFLFVLTAQAILADFKGQKWVVSPEQLSDLRARHLELIQAVISRLAGNASTLKNYAVTLATAVCGLAVALKEPSVMALVLLPIFALALLDGKYLYLERRFRRLYEQVRSEMWASMPTFGMDTSTITGVDFLGTLFSWSVLGFYFPLAAGVLLVGYVYEWLIR
jgi:hypothetical protein